MTDEVGRLAVGLAVGCKLVGGGLQQQAARAARRPLAPTAPPPQEVEQPVYDQQLLPWLGPTHHSLFAPRRLAPGAPGPEEGVSLHVRRAAFDLVDSCSFRFADLAAQVLPPGADRDALAHPLLRVVRRREEGAVAALLRHVGSGRQVLAASTHIFWDPNYPDVKVGFGCVWHGAGLWIAKAMEPGRGLGVGWWAPVSRPGCDNRRVLRPLLDPLLKPRSWSRRLPCATGSRSSWSRSWGRARPSARPSSSAESECAWCDESVVAIDAQ
jgi:hypothetical protein